MKTNAFRQALSGVGIVLSLFLVIALRIAVSI